MGGGGGGGGKYVWGEKWPYDVRIIRYIDVFPTGIYPGGKGENHSLTALSNPKRAKLNCNRRHVFLMPSRGFSEKNIEKYSRLSSAAVVIGALRVKSMPVVIFCIFFFSHSDDEEDLIVLKNYEEHLKESRKIFHDQLVKTEQMKEVRLRCSLTWSDLMHNE